MKEMFSWKNVIRLLHYYSHGKLNSFHRRKYREISTFEAEKIAIGMQISEK